MSLPKITLSLGMVCACLLPSDALPRWIPSPSGPGYVFYKGFGSEIIGRFRDFNGDGVAEMIVSDPSSSGTFGVVFIVDPKTGEVLRSLREETVREGLPQSNRYFGSSLAIRNPDQPGMAPELLIGAPGDSQSLEGGAVYVCEGNSLSLLTTFHPSLEQFPNLNELPMEFGEEIGVVHGTASGDPDYLAASAKIDSGAFPNIRVQILDWDTGALDSRIMNSQISLTGFVKPYPDLDHDGKGEVLSGCPSYDVDYNLIGVPDISNVGALYMKFSTGSQIVMPASPAVAGGHLGYDADVIDDLDRDGYPEIAVGCNGQSGDNLNGVTIFDVRRRVSVRSITNPDPNNLEGFGCRVFTLEDFDGDGYRDIGVLGYYKTSLRHEPRLYLVNPRTGNSFGIIKTQLPNVQMYSSMPNRFSASLTSDLNGDGIPEIAMGIGQVEQNVKSQTIGGGDVFLVNSQTRKLIEDNVPPHQLMRKSFRVRYPVNTEASTVQINTEVAFSEPIRTADGQSFINGLQNGGILLSSSTITDLSGLDVSIGTEIIDGDPVYVIHVNGSVSKSGILHVTLDRSKIKDEAGNLLKDENLTLKFPLVAPGSGGGWFVW